MQNRIRQRISQLDAPSRESALVDIAHRLETLSCDCEQVLRRHQQDTAALVEDAAAPAGRPRPARRR